MAKCYGKTIPTTDNDGPTTVIAAGDQPNHQQQQQPQSPLPSSANNSVAAVGSVKNTPARSSSPWASPYTPARSSTSGRRFFKRSFPPPPSPAKHIKASLARRFEQAKQQRAGPIPEDGAAVEPELQSLDKNFGYNKSFGAKYELGKEIGRGHFGHTCHARGKTGELKDQSLAVKIISKANVSVS